MNREILYDHLFVHNYFRCKEQISKTQSYKKDGHKEFCTLCFEPDCKHEFGKDKYRSVIEQLSVWVDLNEVYGRNRFLTDSVPYFPTVGFDTKCNYIAKPILDIPFGIVHSKINGDRIGYVNGLLNEELTKYANKKRFGIGIWYGYFSDRFYLISYFKGRFIQSRKHSLPSIKVCGVTPVKFDTKLDVKGTWYIPQVENYHEFHRYLQRVDEN